MGVRMVPTAKNGARIIGCPHAQKTKIKTKKQTKQKSQKNSTLIKTNPHKKTQKKELRPLFIPYTKDNKLDQSLNIKTKITKILLNI